MRSLKTALLLTSIFLLSLSGNKIVAGNLLAAGEEIVVGETYAIEERDALEEIEEKANGKNWKEILSAEKLQKTLSAASKTLPRADSLNTREYYPYYTLEMDIEDADGNTIYPQGFRYNPLDFIYMPGRIIILGDDEKDITWLKENYQQGDRLITAGGDIQNIQEEVGVPVFKFDEKMRERMGIRSVPSSIVQKGNKLLITEYVL